MYFAGPAPGVTKFLVIATILCVCARGRMRLWLNRSPRFMVAFGNSRVAVHVLNVRDCCVGEVSKGSVVRLLVSMMACCL